MKRIRLGIIGCGIAARELHWPALKEMKDSFEIAVACNRTVSKAESYAALVGGTDITTDYHNVLKRDDVDAVVIALSYHLNREVTLASIEAGKHVLVEKPLASRITDAQAMVNAAESHPDITCLLAENFRYRPLYDRVAAILDDGEIGTPYQMLWDYCFFVDPAENKYAQTMWRLDEHYFGGFIIDAGVHNIALLRRLFGEISGGHSQLASITPELGRYDTLSFSFSTESGCNGVLNLFYSALGYRDNSLKIFCDKGTLVIERDRITVHREGTDEEIENFNGDMGYIGEFRDFYEGITTGKQVSASFSEGFLDYASIAEAVMSGIENREYRAVSH